MSIPQPKPSAKAKAFMHSRSRPELTREHVEANERTWQDQIGTVLDLARVEIRHNSEWLGRLGSEEILRLAGQLTVAQMLERDSFSQRYASNNPIHLHEFLYCLFQGYDSVAVEADIEIGGSDQTFNLTIGRTLQKRASMLMTRTLVMMTTMLGLDLEQREALVDLRAHAQNRGHLDTACDRPPDALQSSSRV